MPATSATNPSSFAALLAKYPSTHHHRPRRGTNDCDCAFRFTTAPGLVAARRQEPHSRPSGAARETAAAASSSSSSSETGGRGGYLEQAEVVRLVQWKIHHGSYFPSLPKLAGSNDADAVRQVTGEAFALLASASASAPSTPPPDDNTRVRAVMAALDTLTRLRGVGPATASLLLSVADAGASVPFFADEVFVWARRGFDVDAPRPLPLPNKTSGGVKIKYSAKEYEELLTATWGVLGRLRGEAEGAVVKASDVEKVARVLGVLGKDEVGDGGGGAVVDDGGQTASKQRPAADKKRKRVAPTSASPPLPAKGPKLKQSSAARAAPSAKAEESSSLERRVMPRRAARPC